MSTPSYPTKPVETKGMPPGIPYIIGNEAAERFCYYGLSAILTMFMVKKLQPTPMTEEEAKASFHLFTFGAYFMPVFGAILSDVLWGKFRTILVLSVVYCLGCFALAADSTRMGLAIGLSLIAVGTGGIKPCVSANVGDQFGEANKHLLPRAFSWFYFSINFGSFFSTLLTPWLLEKYGPRVAFGVPGIFMALATLVFWLGRHKFVRVPPTGIRFFKEVFSSEGLIFLLRLLPIYFAVAIFWSLWNQTMSAWVLQADKMNRVVFGFNILPSQVQALNPILVLSLIPVCTYLIYPLIDRVFKLTPLRKIGIGFFLTVPSFLLPAYIESQITAGHQPHVIWQFYAYVLISLAEIMVSITCLEFSYTQAPKSMKSFIMSFYLLSVAAGNLVTSAINYFIQNPDKTSKLPGASYYLFFTGMMAVTAVLFIFVAITYKERKDESAPTGS